MYILSVYPIFNSNNVLQPLKSSMQKKSIKKIESLDSRCQSDYYLIDFLFGGKDLC